jgi:hypothetical protein
LKIPMHTWDSSTVGSDTLTTPGLLVTIATNSRKASVGRIAINSRKASVGCLATNSMKASVFYWAVRVLYSEQQQRAPFSQPPKLDLVSGIRVSQSLEAEEYSARSEPVFRRVSVVSE